MPKLASTALVAIAVSGCGLAGTAATAASMNKSAADEQCKQFLSDSTPPALGGMGAELDNAKENLRYHLAMSKHPQEFAEATIAARTSGIQDDVRRLLKIAKCTPTRSEHSTEARQAVSDAREAEPEIVAGVEADIAREAAEMAAEKKKKDDESRKERQQIQRLRAKHGPTQFEVPDSAYKYAKKDRFTIMIAFGSTRDDMTGDEQTLSRKICRAPNSETMDCTCAAGKRQRFIKEGASFGFSNAIDRTFICQ